MGEAMKLAVEDLKAHPDQYLRDVAERHGARLSNLRSYVEKNGLPYKKKYKRRSAESERQRLSQPAFREPTPEERKLIEWARAQRELERSGSPAEVRMRKQLAKKFEALAALWGEWIKE